MGSGQDARAGIAEAHIALVQHLGRTWAHDNINALISHWAHLCSHPKCLGAVQDELFVRTCASAVLRYACGHMLGEAGQSAAAGHLAALVKKGVSEHGTLTPSAAASRSTLAVALTELGNLVRELDGSAVAVLVRFAQSHACAAARDAATTDGGVGWGWPGPLERLCRGGDAGKRAPLQHRPPSGGMGLPRARTVVRRLHSGPADVPARHRHAHRGGGVVGRGCGHVYGTVDGSKSALRGPVLG